MTFHFFDETSFLSTVRMDIATVEELQLELDDLTNELDELMAIGEDDLADSDMDRLEELEKLINRKKRLIDARAAAEAARKPRARVGRKTSEPGTPRRGETVPAEPKNQAEAGTHGFRHFGEFAMTVIAAGNRQISGHASATERLHNAATTYGSEGAGADGGFIVPPDFRAAIWQKVRGEDSLLSRCAEFTTGGNSLTIPKDETTPWDNTAGIRVFWEGEGEAATASKPKFETTTARLNKLMALINITEELYDDAPGLESYLRYWTPVKMTSRLNTAVVRGTAVGMPQGILNANSLITIAKEASQDAASILMPNINNMWNRLYAPLRSDAIWLINQECEPQLEGMQFIPANEHGSAATAAYYPIYMPAGGLSERPYATLKGRPVVPVQACSALGTVGDIILVSLSQYMVLTKGNGIQEDFSIHLYFDQAVDALRFIFRATGQPLWNNVITPENGSSSYSWAVAMEDRT